MITIRVMYLGPARNLAACEGESLELPDGATVADARSAVCARREGIAKAAGSIRCAVNMRYAKDGDALADGDELALIPPVSGGRDDETIAADLIALTGQDIDPQEIMSAVAGDSTCGGIACFAGATRAESDADHGLLAHLEYEAYTPMAMAGLRALAGEARARWPVQRVALVHRVGIVPVGRIAVVTAAACPHRAEAFEACRFLIDALKRDIPIWKRDVFADGFTRWAGPLPDGGPPGRVDG